MVLGRESAEHGALTQREPWAGVVASGALRSLVSKTAVSELPRPLVRATCMTQVAAARVDHLSDATHGPLLPPSDATRVSLLPLSEAQHVALLPPNAQRDALIHVATRLLAIADDQRRTLTPDGREQFRKVAGELLRQVG